MLRIGICDDNREDIARIRELAVRFSEEHPETPVQIQAYGQPYDLLDEVEKSGGFDLYLLDVVMPHMTGVALARRLRERKERAEILFLTVSKEYAVDAFSVKAAGYLIKPVSKPDFDGAVLECIHRLLPENNPSLMLKSKDGLYRVPVGELVCVESFNHNQVCTLADGLGAGRVSYDGRIDGGAQGAACLCPAAPGVYRQHGFYPQADGPRAAADKREAYPDSPKRLWRDEKRLFCLYDPCINISRRKSAVSRR